jgi:hypothetical protein
MDDYKCGYTTKKKKIFFFLKHFCFVFIFECVFSLPTPSHFQIPSFLVTPKGHGDFLLGLTPPLVFEAIERFLDCSIMCDWILVMRGQDRSRNQKTMNFFDPFGSKSIFGQKLDQKTLVLS